MTQCGVLPAGHSTPTPNAQLNFERVKEMKMSAFVADFMKEYESTGLPPEDISCITNRRLGAFLHLALFQAWSDAIYDNKKPPIECPVDCLVGRYALPVVYYVAGWTLFSMSKATTIAARTTGLYVSHLRLLKQLMRERQRG